MDLAKRDQKIELLRDLLDDRKHFLKERNQQLQEASKDNEFLVEVAEDYARFYSTIKQQKQAQIAALMELSRYISESANQLQEADQLLKDICRAPAGALQISWKRTHNVHKIE